MSARPSGGTSACVARQHLCGRYPKTSIPASIAKVAARHHTAARTLMLVYRNFGQSAFECQASEVSGVTMVATSARIFLPNPLAFEANRRH